MRRVTIDQRLGWRNGESGRVRAVEPTVESSEGVGCSCEVDVRVELALANPVWAACVGSSSEKHAFGGRE
jgi:hypothetical protein